MSFRGQWCRQITQWIRWHDICWASTCRYDCRHISYHIVSIWRTCRASCIHHSLALKFGCKPIPRWGEKETDETNLNDMKNNTSTAHFSQLQRFSSTSEPLMKCCITEMLENCCLTVHLQHSDQKWLKVDIFVRDFQVCSMEEKRTKTRNYGFKYLLNLLVRRLCLLSNYLKRRYHFRH